VSLRSRNAHGHVTRAISCGNLRELPDAPAGPLFRADLRSRNAHGHVTRTILCGNLQGNLRTPPDTTSNEHRALTYRKNPSVRQCGHTVWEKAAPNFPKSTQNALLVKCPGPAPPFLLEKLLSLQTGEEILPWFRVEQRNQQLPEPGSLKSISDANG